MHRVDSPSEPLRGFPGANQIFGTTTRDTQLARRQDARSPNDIDDLQRQALRLGAELPYGRDASILRKPAHGHLSVLVYDPTHRLESRTRIDQPGLLV